MKDLSVSDLSTPSGPDDSSARPLPLLSLFFGAGPHFSASAPAFAALGAPWQRVDDVSQLRPLVGLEHDQRLTWTDALRVAHVAADRHNSPDLLGQIHQAIQRPPHTVICAVLDVDPAACLNSALASRYGVELVAGVLSAARITGAERARIVTDHRVPGSWFTTLHKSAHVARVSMDAIVHTYPLADPAVLVYLLRRRPLRPRRLPTEQGVLVLDAAAAVALGRYALLSEPMTQVPIALRDHVLNRSHYLIVPMGTTVAGLLARLVLPWKDRVVRGGDLLRDCRLSPETALGAGELMLHSSAPDAPANPSPCMRCGWCVDACPTRVHPATVLEAAQRQDQSLAESAGVEACIECGLCTYVCPSSLPLMEGAKRMKSASKTAVAVAPVDPAG
jgi:Na+-translocating ferredoxin:NAD+ oxidoreductase RnfC subunit